ncbi:MAG: carboxymuconolactone decarboxylase family protein [Pirellulaceae bacterium]|jgi:alkylhydroperoxidase/carboxymuconolactone decarboxylase family protein YurZ
MDVTEFKVKESLDATGATDALTDREKHLIGLAVTATRGCIACTGGRIENALKSSIEYETVRAAIDLAAAVNAGVTLRTAIEGAARNGVQENCSTGECSIGVDSKAE